MSKKSDLLKHKVEKFLHYYEIFEQHGDCKAVRSHALLRDIHGLIPELQNEIDNRLRALEYLDE